MLKALLRRISSASVRSLAPLEEHAHQWRTQIGARDARISVTSSGGIIAGFDRDLGLSHGWLSKADIRPRLGITFEPTHSTLRGHVAVNVRMRDFVLGVAAHAECSEAPHATSMTSRCLSFFDGAVLGSAQFFGIKPIPNCEAPSSSTPSHSPTLLAHELRRGLEELQRDFTKIPRTREGQSIEKILTDTHLNLCTASARSVVWKSNFSSVSLEQQPLAPAEAIPAPLPPQKILVSLASNQHGADLMRISIDSERSEVVVTAISPKALPVARTFPCAEELCLYVQGLCAGYVAGIVAREAQLHEPRIPDIG